MLDINGIIYYLLLSLFALLQHCGYEIYFFFVITDYSFLPLYSDAEYKYIILFTTDGYLSNFQLGAFTNSTAINILVCVIW